MHPNKFKASRGVRPSDLCISILFLTVALWVPSMEDLVSVGWLRNTSTVMLLIASTIALFRMWYLELLWVLLFAIAAFISWGTLVLLIRNGDVAWQVLFLRTVTLLTPMLVGLWAAVSLRKQAFFIGYLFLLIAWASILSTVFSYYYMRGNPYFTGRAVSVLGVATVYPLIHIVLASALLQWSSPRPNGFYSYLTSVTVILLIMTGFLSGARGYVLFCGIWLGGLAWLKMRGRTELVFSHRTVWIVLVLVGVTGGILASAWGRVNDAILRLTSFSTESAAASTSSRYAHATEAIERWIESPLVGRGFSYITLLPKRMLPPRIAGVSELADPHNTWVMLMTEYGLVGLVLLFFLLLYLNWVAIRILKTPSWVQKAGVLSIPVISMSTLISTDFLKIPEYNTFLWIPVALALLEPTHSPGLDRSYR